jgi:hypothetical protein
MYLTILQYVIMTAAAIVLVSIVIDIIKDIFD